MPTQKERPPENPAANLNLIINMSDPDRTISGVVSSIVAQRDDRYCADDRWCARFEEVARRAARDPKFYEIAGGNIQRRADELRAGGESA